MPSTVPLASGTFFFDDGAAAIVDPRASSNIVNCQLVLRSTALTTCS